VSLHFTTGGTTAHKDRLHKNLLRDMSDKRRIWPPRSPDTSPLDFYLWSVQTNSHILQELNEVLTDAT